MVTSNIINGVTNVTSISTLGTYLAPDPSRVHQYFNDFDNYLAATEWTITTTGTGTRALSTTLDGGVLVVTNSAADNDANFFDKIGSSFLMEAGKQSWFKARFKLSDATQSDFVIGLQITDTTPLDVSDGIYFLKSDDAATLDVICRKNSTTGSTSATAIATLTDDTFVTVGWYYDGVGNVYYFVNDNLLGKLDGSATYLPDAPLTISFGIQNGEAVAKVLSVDYLMAAKER